MRKNVIYGINPVREALKAGNIETVFVSSKRIDPAIMGIIEEAKGKDIEVKKVDPYELDKIAGPVRHQGVAAFMREYFHYSSLDDAIRAWKDSGGRAFFLMLDSIQDPQNMGSLIRTAHACGLHAVIVPKDRSCPVTPAVFKASAGASVHTAVARVTNLRDTIKSLKEQGVWVYAIEADSKHDIYSIDLKTDLAIVVGGEGKGTRRLVREECDDVLSIPMKGKINSLNASVAGAVAMFEALRQRQAGGEPTGEPMRSMGRMGRPAPGLK